MNYSTHRPRISLALAASSLAILALACSLGGGTAAPPTAEPATQPPTVAAQPTLPEPTQPPPTQAPPTQAPEPSPTSPAPIAAGELQVTAVHGYWDTLGSLNVVGLVSNQTERTYDSIEVEVEIFDAGGTSLHRETTFAHLYNLAPGETTPFSLYVFEDLPSADNFVATIVGSSAAEIERGAVVLQNMTLTTDDDGDMHVTGELFNDGDLPLEINSLAAATFASDGGLFTADSSSVSISFLDPGEDGPFRVTMFSPSDGAGDVTDFQVYVDAQVADSVDPMAISFSESDHIYFDGFDQLHLVGWVTNEGSESLNLRLVAAIYDAAGNVLDAASLDTVLSSLAPGETVPYDFDSWGPLNYSANLFDSADTYSVQMDSYWSWTSDTVTFDLETDGDAHSFSNDEGTFIGQVVNSTGGPIGSAVVIVYLTDLSTGEIVAMGYTGLYEEIADGASTGYTIYVSVEPDFDPASVEVTVFAKGERP